MRKLYFLIMLLIGFACKKEDVDQLLSLGKNCKIKQYITDTTGGRPYTKASIRYNGKRISEINWVQESLFPMFSTDSIRVTNSISYNSQGNPSKVGARTFTYNKKDVLENVITYERDKFPKTKYTFEWQNNQISKIMASYFVINGSPNKIENYIEQVSKQFELSYDSRGNIAVAKVFSSDGNHYLNLEYQYDSQVNPFKNLSLLAGEFSTETLYSLSANNLVKVTYSFVDGGLPTILTFDHTYYSNGFPQNGNFGMSRIMDIQYVCD